MSFSPLRATRLRRPFLQLIPTQVVTRCRNLSLIPLTPPSAPPSQIASLTEYPALISHPEASKIFPADALARAKTLMEEIGSVGAYSHSMGVPAIRKRVAEFIERASSSLKGFKVGGREELTSGVELQSAMDTRRPRTRST